MIQQHFINFPGCRISYLEKNPAGNNTIFFIHGNSGSARTWNQQFIVGEFENYRLIAFDIPGTGHSEITDPVTWDYSPIQTGKMLADCVKTLSKGLPFILTGFSYGTNVIGEMLQHDLKPAGVALVGACVIGEGYTLDKVFAAGDFVFFHDAPEQKVVHDFFFNSLKNNTKELVDQHTEDFYRAKPPFRTALIQSVVQGKYTDEVESLKKLGIPLFIIFGEDDNLLQIDYLDHAPLPVWNNTIYKLPGAKHYVQSDQPARFNLLLAEYVKERL